MKKQIALDTYDHRRFDGFSDIECRECAYFGPTCGNAVTVLEAMRSRGNDMSMPVFDFTPAGDLNASQCPGMWPSEDYLRGTGQSMRESAYAFPTSVGIAADALLSQADGIMAELDRMAPSVSGEAA